MLEDCMVLDPPPTEDEEGTAAVPASGRASSGGGTVLQATPNTQHTRPARIFIRAPLGQARV